MENMAGVAVGEREPVGDELDGEVVGAHAARWSDQFGPHDARHGVGGQADHECERLVDDHHVGAPAPTAPRRRKPDGAGSWPAPAGMAPARAAGWTRGQHGE